MPNVRGPNQKLLNFPVESDFERLINDGVRVGGFSDRSKLIREALKEKLESLGLIVPDELIAPPSRVGKGGRRKTIPPKSRTVYPPGNGGALVLNESRLDAASSAEVERAAESLLAAAVAEITGSPGAPPSTGVRKPKAAARRRGRGTGRH